MLVYKLASNKAKLIIQPCYQVPQSGRVEKMYCFGTVQRFTICYSKGKQYLWQIVKNYQGRRIKDSLGLVVEGEQDFEQIVIVPAGHFSLSFGRDFLSPSVASVLVILDHVQSDFAN